MADQDIKSVVLIIDDDELIRICLADYLLESGFDAIQACDGLEGIKAVRAVRPDIIITDMSMPKIGGLEVVDTVRQMDDNLPIIVLSGASVLTEAVLALQRGAWEYLTKPLVNLSELKQAVDRCLERARLIRENRNYQENLEQMVCQRTAELRTLSTAVEQSANAVVITNVDGIIEYVNPKFTETTGYTSEEALGKSPRILKSNAHDTDFYQNLWETIRSGREWKGEFYNKTKDGGEYWEFCSIAPIRDEAGVIIKFVAIKEDITARKQNEARLYRQANHDILTDLPNRFFTLKLLSQQIHQMDTNSHDLSLMMLGIDNLKFVNDTFGHDFGDLLLIEVSKRLNSVIPDGCTATRFLGDQFVIIPTQPADAEDAVLRAEHICSAMNTVFLIEGTEVVTTASIGVVVYPEDGECAEKLLKNAEAALNDAKKRGKNKVSYYTRELNSQLEHRFSLKTKLHKALEKGEFGVLYQPQIDVTNNTVIGVEALLRWTPTGEAPVPIDQFIPLLEESGLIVEVGEWVLLQACQQAVEWLKQGLPPFRMSVNISALQFIRSDLDATVRRVLTSTGLDPSHLCLELTESMLMIDGLRTVEIMTSLKEIGISLSLDDFGTGYSSLEYLGRLPIDELKIDRSFVQRMLTTKNDAVVVSTIIAMAQSMEMELVAEGVETKEELHNLLNKKCSTIQGYFFSKPLTPQDLVRFCSNWA